MMFKVLLIMCCVCSFGNASLYYVKSGAHYSAEGYFLPSLGVGARFQKNRYGFDLSCSAASMVFVNEASVKGLFLFYPRPQKKRAFYCGIGPGLGYQQYSVPVRWGGTNENAFASIEGALGYEFRRDRRLKTFVQLEAGHPFIGKGWLSGALSGGIGF